jgi:ribosomal-protein-alanine N-acetyltransferase
LIDFDAYRAPALQTARLLLEPVNAWHGETLFPGLKDPMLYAFIAKEPPLSTSEVSRRFEKLESRRSPDGEELWLNWAARRINGGYVGLVEATVGRDAIAHVAYWVFSADQRQGFGREAVAVMLEHLAAIGCVEAVAFIDTRNAASIRLVEALGFERRQTLVMREKLRGRWVDDHEYRKSLERGLGGA